MALPSFSFLFCSFSHIIQSAMTNRPKKANLCALSLASALLIASTFAGTARAQTRWVASWAASQQIPEPSNALARDDLRDATLRQVVHLSIGGTQLRVHLSNRFGIAPLAFAAVHVAEPVSPGSAKIIAGTDKAVTFFGSTEVTVPAGADYISDPIAFAAAPLSSLTITLYLETPPARQTGHPGSRATSYLAHGDLVSAADLPGQTVEHWYFISAVDVAAPREASSIATFGDSITDGHGATKNGNDRWPDLLAQRLQASPQTRNLAVINLGTGGNRLLLDGLGPDALARFDAAVRAQTGVRYLIVLEGVNDLGMLTRDGDVPKPQHAAMVHQILAAYEQIVERAHAQRIKVVAGTIMPFLRSNFYHPGPNTEADRQAINEWIRDAGHFDAVVDFDQVLRDPEHPEQLAPKFDSGDHLHPSPAGYAAMADAVPLALFREVRTTAFAKRGRK
jgi:lysophospholipase L1-like esterase